MDVYRQLCACVSYIYHSVAAKVYGKMDTGWSWHDFRSDLERLTCHMLLSLAVLFVGARWKVPPQSVNRQDMKRVWSPSKHSPFSLYKGLSKNCICTVFTLFGLLALYSVIFNPESVMNVNSNLGNWVLPTCSTISIGRYVDPHLSNGVSIAHHEARALHPGWVFALMDLISHEGSLTIYSYCIYVTHHEWFTEPRHAVLQCILTYAWWCWHTAGRLLTRASSLQYAPSFIWVNDKCSCCLLHSSPSGIMLLM